MSEGRRSQRLARKRDADDTKPEEPAVSEPKRAKTAEARTREAPERAQAASTRAALAVGDALPDVELLDQDGAPVRVTELEKAVLFTYPRANTPGCTKQAQGYRDAHDDWAAAGYAVYGLSSDAPRSQKTWATKLGLAYRLLSDPERVLIGALTGTRGSTKRSHFVVRDGRLAHAAVGVKPGEVRGMLTQSSTAALEAARAT